MTVFLMLRASKLPSGTSPPPGSTAPRNTGWWMAVLILCGFSTRPFPTKLQRLIFHDIPTLHILALEHSMGLQLSLPTGHLQSPCCNTLDSAIRGARTLEGANFDPVRIVTASPVPGCNRSEDIRFRDSGSNTLVPNADPLV